MYFDPLKKQKKGVAFVASTLPAKIVKKQIDEELIETIYTSTEGLKESYKMILTTGRKVDIKSLSETNFFKRTILLYKVLKCEKENKNWIYIYHECCWPWLDILIKFLRPNGYHIPQAKIEYMYQPVGSSLKFYKHLHFIRASILVISKVIFNYHQFRSDSGVGLMFLPVIKKYPKSIYLVNESEIKPRKTYTLSQKRMLIVGGTDLVDTSELIILYKKIIDKAIQMDYEVFYKDHPNYLMSLNVNFENTQVISSKIPLEIIDVQFSIVLGTASAAMVGYGYSAVSICKLINSMSESDKILRINYLLSHNPDARIVKDIDEIFL